MQNVDRAHTLATRLALIARRFPARLAVADERRTLTFGELAAQVDTLAKRLAVHTEPGSHVAVLLPRGTDYLIAAYAIWQVHGVFLPLDRSWPRSRIDAILQQADVCLLIHAEEGQAIALAPRAKVIAKLLHAPGTPAYIIHTSGTTGRPKGVVITHQALLHLVDSHQRCLYVPNGLLEGAVAMNASFCFDSAMERLALVAQGYCLHIVGDDVRKSPHALIALLRDRAILNVDLVPSHLKVLLDAGLIEQAKALRMVIVGGEAIDQALWARLAHSRVRFINVYGPTENTINTTFAVIAPDAAEPHIGKPFAELGCRIVDEALGPCAPGEAGELLVSGAHLAQGYYNAPDLTAAAFVTRDGVRYYRTGDRVRMNASGDFVFLGRIDDQIKVNGHRVEPAEVQAHLAALPAVRFAAVTPVKQEGGTALLASVVLDDETTTERLATALAESLPAYMVPVHWQTVDELPLTDNLKLDHRALLQRWQTHSPMQAPANAPLSSREQQLQRIWQSVLGRAVTTPEAHFFASGGDSMAAMKLMLSLKQSTGIQVDFATLFKHPTIRSMAAWLDQCVPQSKGPPPIRSGLPSNRD